MTRTTEARFWEKVRVADVADPDACWLWTGAQNGNGHGSFWLDGAKGGAHCHAYRVFVGPIPAGLQIDHVCHSRDLSCPGGKSCRHRRCVNPDHLEAVTPRENTRRGRGHGSETHCPQGHSYDESNTSYNKKGRVCLACKRLWMAENRHRVKRRVGQCGGCSLPDLQLVARGLCARCYDRQRSPRRRSAA